MGIHEILISLFISKDDFLVPEEWSRKNGVRKIPHRRSRQIVLHGKSYSVLSGCRSVTYARLAAQTQVPNY